MNKPSAPTFAKRPTVTIDLPLPKDIRILHPDQVILKTGAKYHDLGAFCYALRSDTRRSPGQPREVVINSFLEQRCNPVLKLIKAVSGLHTDGGMTLRTVKSRLDLFKMFLDWADLNGLHECLSGGDPTHRAYQAWADDIRERYLRQEIGVAQYNYRLDHIREFLEATTGLEDLHHGINRVKGHWNNNASTEPLAPQDFAHAIALNQALFDGLSDLVLMQRPFPYKLMLPASLGWKENHLWLFPTIRWRLAPFQMGTERENLKNGHWAYDYANGRLATEDEIMRRYREPTPGRQRATAKLVLQLARGQIDTANADARDRIRIMLGMIAHNAFLFLFFANTGANESVAREVETDGEVDAATLNQRFRSIKLRAGGKTVTLAAPATFMPSLRRFMDLRRYLLDGSDYPYLFFSLGSRNASPPRRITDKSLQALVSQLQYIDPTLPNMGPRKLRASVADWYQNHYDASVTAKVLQNSEETVQKHYDSGSAIDHRDELSLFLNSVSESAKRQRVIRNDGTTGASPLDEGGHCDNFGNPEALADNVPAQPNCHDSAGCLFCAHRILVACEEDTRKVASAAFVMEQAILGPKHEEALRPLITKCDEDIKKIASFGNCREMVDRVRNDVFQNGNLTPFFADKYQLLLELGVIA